MENNLVQALHIEGNQLRYDADVSAHGHFKCESCNTVYDFDVDKENYPEVPLDGFVIQQKEYCVTGICRDCASASNN